MAGKTLEQSKRKMRIVLGFLSKRYGAKVRNSMTRKRSGLFRLLVTTVLSQRSRDETTEAVAEKLFSVVRTPEDVARLGRAELERIIRPSGPFRQKAGRIKQISSILARKYKGSFPATRAELIALPGVGPKTADIVLSYGYGEPVIAIDVHVEVVSKRLGFARRKAKYEEIRASLEKLVPEDERAVVNLGMVNFGKEICITRRPRCEACGLTRICAYYKRFILPGLKRRKVRA